MIILLRHANDNEEEATHMNDAHITKSGKRKAKKKAKYLVKKYGFPERILCSPYVRARETLKVFCKYLKKLDPDKYRSMEKRIDRRLSRFFTPTQQKNPEIRDDTQRFRPPIYEDIPKMMVRLQDHVKSCLKKGYLNNAKQNTWCISHGLAIKKLMLSLGNHAPESVPFLEHYPLLYSNKKIIHVKDS